MPSSLPPSLSHIKETCLYIRDTAETRAFYEASCGWPALQKCQANLSFLRWGLTGCCVLSLNFPATILPYLRITLRARSISPLKPLPQKLMRLGEPT